MFAFSYSLAQKRLKCVFLGIFAFGYSLAKLASTAEIWHVSPKFSRMGTDSGKIGRNLVIVAEFDNSSRNLMKVAEILYFVENIGL